MSEEFLGIDWEIDPDTNDWVLDGVGEPTTVVGRLSLAQGLRDRVRFDPDVLGSVQRELAPGEAADLLNLVQIVAERDPRVVAGGAKATLHSLDAQAGVLEISLSVQPVGADRLENLIVRTGI